MRKKNNAMNIKKLKNKRKKLKKLKKKKIESQRARTQKQKERLLKKNTATTKKLLNILENDSEEANILKDALKDFTPQNEINSKLLKKNQN